MIIGTTVAGWAATGAGALGATAGTAGTIGALAGAVAVGVVTGAVMGAVTAAISGQNIFEGALKGAVIGGVSAGVLSGLGMATGLYSAADQMAAYGLAENGAALATPTAKVGTAAIQASQPTSLSQGGAHSGNALNGVEAAKASMQAPVADTGGGLLSGMSDKTVEVLAGGAEGAMKGLGSVGASMMEGDSAKELSQWESQQAAIDKANNVPGEYEAYAANITVPDWWEKYLTPGAAVVTPQAGILSQGVSA